MNSKCRKCWWREGNRCYYGDPEIDNDGRSVIPADGTCLSEAFQSKREILEQCIPSDNLVIVSEHNSKLLIKEEN